ncbi:MAG: BatA domain-containing protein [Saprospiraceae bacterium]
MQFLYPTFLWALLALAIPIIIHLFYFRRFKKVYFTNVKFLKEVKEETSARSRLKNLLTLLMRLLAMAALVFAFAQPFIPVDTEVKKGQKAVSLFVDNSFSMNALSEDVPLIEKGKQRAREIISAHNDEDEFQVLTNDFEGRHQRMVSKEDALALVDEIRTSPSVRALSNVLARQKQVLNALDADNNIHYLISDFQKNITDITNYADTIGEVNLVPLQSVQEKNISVDSCWFDAPVQMVNQTNKLVIRVRNHSDTPADNLRLSLQYDGQEKPVGTLSIPANSYVIDTVTLTIQRTGWHEAKIAVTDYPVQFDDHYFFSFNVAEVIKVLSINEVQANKYLNAAFTGVPYFAIDNKGSQNLDYSQFASYQMIVLNELNSISSGLAFELNQYTKNGGNLLVFPSRNANIATYKGFLSAFQANQLVALEQQEKEVGRVNYEEFVFKDVFEGRRSNVKLPVTQVSYKLTTFGRSKEEKLLTYRDGTSFLSKYRFDKGNLYLCAAPLEENYSNLVKNGEIFIPMLYKMAISTAKSQRIAYTIGKDDFLEAENQQLTGGNETVYKLKGTAEEFIPEQTKIGSKVILGVYDQVKTSGYYDLFLKEGETKAKYAFNYDRKESKLDYWNEADLATEIGPNVTVLTANSDTNYEQLIGERNQGIPLWRWAVIATLIFLGIEGLLLRFWKV